MKNNSLRSACHMGVGELKFVASWLHNVDNLVLSFREGAAM